MKTPGEVELEILRRIRQRADALAEADTSGDADRRKEAWLDLMDALGDMAGFEGDPDAYLQEPMFLGWMSFKEVE